jgi:TPR repeat protein
LAGELPSVPLPAEPAEAPVLLRVVVGTGPVEVPLPETERPIVLREPPRHGRLVAVDAAGDELTLSAAPVRPATLRYLPPQAMRRGVDEVVLGLVEPSTEMASLAPSPEADGLAEPSVTRSLEAPSGDVPSDAAAGAAAGDVQTELAAEAYVVQLEITVDPCDELAATRLDTQGVVLGNFLGEIDTDAAIPACEAAVAAYPDEPRFLYQLGRSVEQAGEHERAAELYEEAAAGGHLLGFHRLGYLHLIGRGVPQDTEKAIALFETAAAGGETYAMNSLARAYASGEGVEQDREKAMDLYLRAAAQGNTFAYNNLGYLLAEEGRGDRALPLFQASAEAGDVYGYNNMGYAYQRGIGVEPDIEEAIDWYERAAEGGQPNAPINLGFIYRDGAPGLDPDPERAAFWFAEAAKGGNPWGSVHLAALREAGTIGDAPDPVAAAKLLARVAWIDGEAARNAAEQNYGGAGNAARERFAALPLSAIVTAVQSELTRLGFDPGPVDGLPGARTDTAVDAFLASVEPPLPADLPPIEILAELVRQPSG